MDFTNLIADENHWLNKHFTSGRAGRKIEYTVIHYAAGNLSLKGYYNVWQTRQASAQYAVDQNGRIGQYVKDANTAWTNGNFDANCKSITIEHSNIGNEFSEMTIEYGARLVAAIHKAYGLGLPQWMVNVFPHNHFAATSCPGPLSTGTEYNRRFMLRAQAWYLDGADNNGDTAVLYPAAPKSLSDGLWGSGTTRRLQEVVGAPYVDGIISRQNAGFRANIPGCTTGWEFTPGGRVPGSQTISHVQERLGVNADGLIGPNTVNALIRRYKSESGATVEDARLDAPSRTIKAMQERLSDGRF